MAKLTDEQQKSLDLAIKQIDKSYGKGTLMKLGDKADMDIDVIPTGSIGFDLALGVGGFPKGRVVEIYGPESSGKTTLTLHAIAECQKEGGLCAFIDAEHALDTEYAKKIGVDIDNLLISQPDYGEQALDIVETLVRSGTMDLIVVDSVAALTPKVEIDGDMDDQQVGVQARLMSKALRKLTSLMNQTKTTIIFINQIRMKIGMTGYGSPETTTGGNALKFYSSVRIDIRRIATIKQGEDSIGNKVKVKVVKNKVAAPFKVVEFEIMFGKGISKSGEIIEHGVKADIVDKAGAWFSYNDKKLGQGKEKSKETIENDPVLFAELEEKIKSYLFGNVDEEYTEEDAANEADNAKAESKEGKK